MRPQFITCTHPHSPLAEMCRACRNKERHIVALIFSEQRFWKHVSKTPYCWLWQGALNNSGYGSFRGVGAHRWAYEHFRDAIPAGFEIDHLCRNKACVNPDHLELVSHRENSLRSGGWAMRHATATHCPAGHPYDVTNTNHRRGRRYCRECDRIRDKRRHDAAYWREYRQKRKATMLDTSESGYAALCGEQTSGPCPVEVGENP